MKISSNFGPPSDVPSPGGSSVRRHPRPRCGRENRWHRVALGLPGVTGHGIFLGNSRDGGGEVALVATSCLWFIIL